MKILQPSQGNSPLMGKRLGVFGSSTSDESYIGSSVYHKLIANRTGLVVVSQALAGTELIPATSDYTLDPALNMLRQIDALPTNLDMVVGMVGANDERNSRTVGTFNSLATWDFYSSLHKMCQKMLDRWPNIPIGIMTSQYMGNPTAGTVVTLQTSAYHNAIAEVCAYYGIPFIDMAKQGRTPYSYLPFKNLHVRADGLHLTDSGNEILSRSIEAFYLYVYGLGAGSVIPAKPTLASDKFTRSSNNTSAGATDTGQVWTALQGTWGIGNNALRVATRSSANTGSGLRDVLAVETGQKDVTITAKQLYNQPPAGIAFRVTDSLNFLMLVSTSSGYQLYKVIAGTSTQIIPTTITAAIGDIISVTCKGDNLTITINNNNIFTAMDSFNNTATKHGFISRGYEGIDLFDDFVITSA